MDAKGPPHCRDPVFSAYFWKKIFTALTINAVTVPLVIALLFASGLVDEPPAQIVEKFKSSYYPFFRPLAYFLDFFAEYALKAALLEELVYRGPIRIAVGLLIISGKETNRRFVAVVWILGLTLNLHWAFYIHTIHEILWIAVFTAGVAWLWLVIKTRSFWPAVICHAMANTLIYFLARIYLLF